MRAAPATPPRSIPTIRSLAVLSVHTSPLAQPGTGDGGGLNVHVLETSRRLAARGVEVDVFTRATDPDQPPAAEVEPGLVVHHVTAGPRAPVDKEVLPGLLDRFVGGLRAHVLDERGGRAYDLVHAHYWLAGMVGRRITERWGVPFAMSFHTLGATKNDARAPGDPPEPTSRLEGEQQLLDEADRIVVSICGEARDLHDRYGLSGARLAVVPPGVDPATFHPGREPEPAQAPVGPGPLLLFVGRLQPLKAPDVAVRTLARVRESVPGARLLVVGGVSGRGGEQMRPEALHALARELGVGGALEVVPAQPQQQLAQLYRAADVVLVPSRTESFGLVALEAQACGTPVVAADVGGLREVVAGGRLVRGHDPADHARAVVQLLRDQRILQRSVAAGLEAAAGVTWDRTVDRLLTVYDEMVRARQRIGA